MTQTLRFVFPNNTADLILELLLLHWFLFLIHHHLQTLTWCLMLSKSCCVSVLLHDEVSSCSYATVLMEV